MVRSTGEATGTFRGGTSAGGGEDAARHPHSAARKQPVNKSRQSIRCMRSPRPDFWSLFKLWPGTQFDPQGLGVRYRRARSFGCAERRQAGLEDFERNSKNSTDSLKL